MDFSKINLNNIVNFVFNDSNNRVLSTLFIIVTVIVLRSIIIRFLIAKIANVRSKYAWRKGISIFFTIFSIFLIGRIWFVGFQELFAVLTLIAAGLTIVHKELILNFSSLGIIVWRGLFHVGDRVQLGDHKGDIIDLGISYLSMLEVKNNEFGEYITGNIIKIPNSVVLTSAIINLTQTLPYNYDDIQISITQNSNWQYLTKEIETIANNATQSIQQNALQLKNRLTENNIQLNEFNAMADLLIKDDAIIIGLRYITDLKNQRTIKTQITSEILNLIQNAEDIKLK